MSLSPSLSSNGSVVQLNWPLQLCVHRSSTSVPLVEGLTLDTGRRRDGWTDVPLSVTGKRNNFLLHFLFIYRGYNCLTWITRFCLPWPRLSNSTAAATDPGAGQCECELTIGEGGSDSVRGEERNKRMDSSVEISNHMDKSNGDLMIGRKEWTLTRNS